MGMNFYFTGNLRMKIDTQLEKLNLKKKKKKRKFSFQTF